MGNFMHYGFAWVVRVDLFQVRGVISDLFTQFAMCRIEQDLTGFHSSGWHFPAAVFPKDVSVLTNQYHVLIINERQYTHTFAAFHHAIDGGLAVGHLGDIFADTRPVILVNWTA